MVQFGVLGPLVVSDDGVPIDIAAPMLRRLLAVLLCRTPGVVSVANALSALWGDNPPPSARKSLQVYVHRLRRILGDGRIDHGPTGYVIWVDAACYDALRFAELLEPARAAYRRAELGSAHTLLDEALMLWRGAAYADADAGELVAAEASRLEEQRLLAQEELVTVELERGRFADVVPRLSDLAATYPYREHLRGQLMVALYHSGRRAEALQVYRSTRELLADELGVEPVPELRRLHESILRDDLPQPRHQRTATAASVPRELPSAVAAFTGREDALGFLDSILPTGTGATVICAIAGMGGVGKTSLAVHWAHRVAPRFPDGQLYVDLRGHASDPPVRPVDALALFLRALGVAAEDVPVDLDRAVRVYRTLLADRRTLVVLDNARDARQVRPLLPGGAGCLVLVTSRHRLTGLVARDGARAVTLEVLSPAESAELLERVFMASDVRVEPEEIVELAVLCGHLPLALRIAAANVPGQAGVAGYLNALRNDRRLADLEVAADPEASVRATLDLSYRALAPAVQRLFRHLGLVPGPTLTVEAAAALVDDSAHVCHRQLGALAAAHVATYVESGRYAVHDLLRQYARELGEATETEDARQAAVARLCEHYLSTVDAAARVLYPAMVRIRLEPPAAVQEFADEEAALGWLDAELPNLVAIIVHAAAHGPRRAAWLLADALRGYFWNRRHYGQWLATAAAGLAAARATGARDGQAAAHLSLALAHRSLADFAAAVEHASAALVLARHLDWLEVQSSALSSLAVAYAETGRTRAALACLTQAHAVAERMDQPMALARSLGNLITLRHNVGDLAGALRDALAVLAICAQVNSPGAEANAHLGAGANHIYLGQFDRAADHLARGHDLFVRIGERYGQAIARGLMAKLRCETGDHAAALPHSLAGLALSRESGDRSAEAVMLTDLATIRTHLGQYDQALRDATEALELTRQARSGHPEVEALIAFAEVHRHAGRPQDALVAARQALALAEQRQYLLLQAEALTSMSASRLAIGDRGGAVASGVAALALHRETGYATGAARTEALLTQAREHPDNAPRPPQR